MDSTISGTTISGPALENGGKLVQSLKRQIDTVGENSNKTAKKSVRWPPTAETPICTPSPLAIAFTNAFVPIGGAMKDFCDYSRQHLPAPKGMSMSTSPLGSYDGCNSIVYIATPPSSLDRQAMGRIPQYQRLGLAERLAVAVLQYHTSPWLKRSWRSEDVHFFCIDENGPMQEPRSFESSHLNVRGSRPNGPVSRASTFPPYTLSRNSVFFSLGVVLLEIAYCANLETLQRSTDLDNSAEDHYTNFLSC